VLPSIQPAMAGTPACLSSAGTQRVMNPHPSPRSSCATALGKTLLASRLFSWLPHLTDKHIQKSCTCQLHQEVFGLGKDQARVTGVSNPACLKYALILLNTSSPYEYHLSPVISPKPNVYHSLLFIYNTVYYSV